MAHENKKKIATGYWRVMYCPENIKRVGRFIFFNISLFWKMAWREEFTIVGKQCSNFLCAKGRFTGKTGKRNARLVESIETISMGRKMKKKNKLRISCYLEWRTATCWGSACSHESRARQTEQSRSSGGANWSGQPTSSTRGFHSPISFLGSDRLNTCTQTVGKKENVYSLSYDNN